MDQPRDVPDPRQVADQQWELDQGIPQVSDPFIHKYFQGRDALLEQERKHRSDHLFRQGLSPMVREASRIVSLIRKKELRDVWNRNFEEKLAHESLGTLYPGMMFTLAKEKMEETMLWRIVKRMPKGALLHAHLSACVDVEWLIEKVLSTPGICIYCSEPLFGETALESGPVRFKYSSSSTTTTSEQDSNIWSSSYSASQLIPAHVAADNFPRGGRPGFKAWLKERCTITTRESIEHHCGVDAIWRKFDSTFPILIEILNYEPIFRAALQRTFQQLASDGISYAEFRVAFTARYQREGRANPQKGYVEWFRTFAEELSKFKTSPAGSSFHGVRIIWAGIRSKTNKALFATMNTCIDMKLRFPDLISGFDLVGPEDDGRTLSDLTPLLFWFRKACAEAEVSIPFFLHAGECLGDGDSTDRNLFDAVALGTRRIGHGISLFKHPLLIEMVKDKRILVESCPISNEILRYSSSILSHPLPALLSRGVACSLNCDAPALMGQRTCGLTHDFWQALNGWDNLGLEGLANMAENSVKWAAFEDQQTPEWLQDIKEGAYGKGIKAEKVKTWSREFEEFCAWVVKEFALEVDESEGEEGEGQGEQ